MISSEDMHFPDKKLVVFDLDDTLSPSKEIISDAMSEALFKLLQHKNIAVITGGQWDRCKTQVLDRLPKEAKGHLHKIFVLPTCGTRMYVYKDDGWHEQYAELLQPDEVKKITLALERGMEGMYDMSTLYGEIIENRGSQVTFSGLGQQAPGEAKKKFDPDQSIRKKIVAKIQDDLSEFEIRIGGATSIDITKKGIDKAFGIRKIQAHLGLTLDEIGFVGDAIFEGGNDYPAFTMGLQCLHVKNPEETLRHIERWVG